MKSRVWIVLLYKIEFNKTWIYILAELWQIKQMDKQTLTIIKNQNILQNIKSQRGTMDC